MKHIIWVDYAKSMAIFMVVLLHVHCCEAIDKTIDAFIMPLFFMLSGFVFRYESNPDYGTFARKRTRQLLVPYLWINAVAYLAWLLVLRHFGADASREIAWHSPLAGIIAGIPPLLCHDTPIWSILSFYVVELAFYPLCRRGLSPWAVTAGAFAAGALSQIPFSGFDPAYLPLALGPSLWGLGFYALGHALRPYLAASSFTHRRVAGAGVAALAVFVPAAMLNGKVEFYIFANGGNYALFLLSGIAGSVAVMSLAAWAAEVAGRRAFISFTASETLLVCGFHLLTFALLKGVALYGFGEQPAGLTGGPLRGICFAVTAFAITLTAIWALRRVLRLWRGRAFEFVR